MSGNNPHGHLSQPQNSSWNPLQIPSYIPRQPQLAHMSNERPMVRSPLAWHTPTPPESLYNFISANHKNLDQLNPLLPSFVRGPSSFDSMDLSLQSNRNSSSPLTKGLSASVPPEFGHKPPPPPPPPSHSQNNFPIHNLSTNSNVHHSQSMSAAPPPPLPKYMNTNGNDVDMQQQACSLYIRDTERINDDYAKMTNRSCENDIQSNLTKAVGLVKECTYTNLSNKMIPSSPKKISPPPPSHQQQLQHQLQQQYSCTTNGPNSPEANNRLTQLGNFNTPLNHMLTAESTASGSCLPPKCGTDLTTANVTENSCNSLSTNDSPANVTSNEDSVDSSGSRTRRKRKPNKTVRMSHDSETDENISLGEQVTHSDKQTPPPLPTTVDVSNSNGSHSLPPELDLALAQENASYGEHRIQEASTPAAVHQSPPGGVDNQQQSQQQLQLQLPEPQQQQQQQLQQLPQQQETNDDRVVDIRSSTESDENLHVPEMPANNSQMHRSDSDDVETIDKIAEMIAKSSNDSCVLNSEDPMSSCSNGSNKKDSSSPVQPMDEDDGDKSPLNAQQETRNSEVPAEQPLPLDKPSDLKAILETSDPSSPTETSQKSSPSPPVPPSQQTGIGEELAGSVVSVTEKVADDKKPSPDNKADNTKSTFEEVEYKLEEMFAGIEDEPQPGTAAPADDIANSEVTTDLSLALALPTTKVKDDDEDSEHKPLSSIATTSNALQKRLHSTAKSEQSPPKKKARLTKKASNRRNKGKVMSASSGSNKTTVAQGNKSKGGGGGGAGSGGGSGGAGSGSNGGGGSGSNGAKSVTAKLEESAAGNIAPESKYRGPYVLVKPDGTINVINAPIAEDDAEKVSKIKKGTYTHVDRSKIRGIHMSTLGNKYDADTADATWMCVFCKKGPHKFGLGDLFGPYIITTKCEEFKSTEKDDMDSEFVSRRKKSEMFQKTPYSLPAVPSTHSNATNVNNKKKKKLSETQTSAMHEKSSEDRFFGMSKVSETSYEVWMHEDCTVWAPGVFLVGARIVGLESSVWSSTNYTCSLCMQKGAMICCLHRGCGQKAHIPCARLSSWDLNEGDFKTHCEKHTQVMDASS